MQVRESETKRANGKEIKAQTYKNRKAKNDRKPKCPTKETERRIS